MCIGLLGLLCPRLLFCFLVFLSLLFNAPTRHTKQLNFYIYICILHNYKLILLVAPHAHTQKDLLKLYLLLNYNISDNRSIGQGKIKTTTKKKPTNLSAGHFFCPGRSVVFPRFFQGLSCAKLRRLQAAPGFCTVSPVLVREDTGAGQFTSMGVCACTPLPW